MGIRQFGNVTLLGNFAKVSRKRPKNWIDKDYKVIVPYPFKWRAKLGRVECDCKEVIECYQPYYGYTFLHGEGCAIRKHLKRYPQINNFLWDRDPTVIAQSE